MDNPQARMLNNYLCRLAFPAGILLLVSACARHTQTQHSAPSIQVSSTALSNGGTYPTKYTCVGAGVSPPVSWKGLPAGTKSVAVVLVDPDAPGGDFTHWVLYNMPPGVTSLPEGVPNVNRPAFAGPQTLNDFGRMGYGGPCPPPGTPHQYILHVYAEDRMLTPGGAGAVLTQIKAHTLAEGNLSATF